MKKKLLVVVAIMLLTTVALSSCTALETVLGFIGNFFLKDIELTDSALVTEKLIDFSEGANPDVLFESDGWSNGDVFNVVWKKNNVKYEDGIMTLGITEEKATAWIDDAEVEYSYTAGEARTQNYYHYGDYEVSMKPSANPGTASTFFVCTGPYDVKDDVPNPHDEIDIEFLGKDTTHVQFNFFVDGKGGNEYMYDLGFDASEEFHTYGFRWEPDAITWFVDGEPVYKVTTDTSVIVAGNLKIVDKLPSTAGRILTNYWCGNERAWGWMGKYDGPVNDEGTVYQWIATSAEGAPLNPVDPPVDGGEGDENPSEPVRLDVEFKTDHANLYTIEAPEQYCDSARITYEGVVGNTWSNVNTWLDGKIGSYDTLSFKIKNDGAEEVNIWLQLQQAGGVNAAEQHLVIPAGEEKAFEVSYSGNIQIALFFIDSSHVVTEGASYSGDITISDIKVCKKNSDEPDDPKPPVDLPDGEYLEFKADPCYTLHNTETYVNVIRVTYSEVSTLTYQNVNAWIKDKAAGKIEWTATIKNDGDAEVYVTLKLETEAHEGLKEEKLYIAPGETKTLVSEFSGEAAFIYFFIDSGWVEGEATTHAGDVTISNIAFSGSAASDEAKGEKLSYVGNDCYTITPAGQATASANVTYTAVSDNTYQNVNASISGATKGYDLMTLKIKNNGSETVTITVKLEDANANGIVEVKVVLAAGEEQLVSLNFGYDKSAEVDKIFFFIDSGWCETTATHAGDVSISEVKYEYAKATGIDLNFTAEENSGYTISGTNEVSVRYDGLGNTWKPITANVADLAAGNDAFTVTIQNNGTSDSRVRVDIQGTTWCSTGDGSAGQGTDACNVSAVGGDVYTDTIWGGSTVTVAAGQSVTLTVYYNENGPQGAVKNVLVYVDSARGDSASFTSDITLSVMNFSTDNISE